MELKVIYGTRYIEDPYSKGGLYFEGEKISFSSLDSKTINIYNYVQSKLIPEIVSTFNNLKESLEKSGLINLIDFEQIHLLYSDVLRSLKFFEMTKLEEIMNGANAFLHRLMFLEGFNIEFFRLNYKFGVFASEKVNVLLSDLLYKGPNVSDLNKKALFQRLSSITDIKYIREFFNLLFFWDSFQHLVKTTKDLSADILNKTRKKVSFKEILLHNISATIQDTIGILTPGNLLSGYIDFNFSITNRTNVIDLSNFREHYPSSPKEEGNENLDGGKLINFPAIKLVK